MAGKRHGKAARLTITVAIASRERFEGDCVGGKQLGERASCSMFSNKVSCKLYTGYSCTLNTNTPSQLFGNRWVCSSSRPSLSGTRGCYSIYCFRS